MLDIVRNHPGCNVNDVCEHFEMSRIAVMKHLRVLEEAGLLISRRDGRARRLFFNATPIQMIHDRWTSEFSALWASRLTGIKYAVESAATQVSGKRGRKAARSRAGKKKGRART